MHLSTIYGTCPAPKAIRTFSLAMPEVFYWNMPGSLQFPPSAPKQAYLYALEADVWLNPNHYTQLAELENLDNRFARVPCFRDGNVWNNNLRSTPEGGSDYYESVPISPHLILADLIAILHPSLLPSHTITYYRQLSRSQAAPQHP
jgi:hypothetical protein